MDMRKRMLHGNKSGNGMESADGVGPRTGIDSMGQVASI